MAKNQETAGAPVTEETGLDMMIQMQLMQSPNILKVLSAATNLGVNIDLGEVGPMISMMILQGLKNISKEDQGKLQMATFMAEGFGGEGGMNPMMMMQMFGGGMFGGNANKPSAAPASNGI